MKALSVEVDATGVKKLQIEITLPETWSEEDIRTVSGSSGIHFQLLINGNAGDWSVNGNLRELDTTDASKRVWYCRAVSGVPLGLLPEIEELTLIPYFSCNTAYYELERDQTGELVIRGKVTPFALDEPFSLWNEYYGGFDVSTTYYPEYALTFSIPQAETGSGG